MSHRLSFCLENLSDEHKAVLGEDAIEKLKRDEKGKFVALSANKTPSGFTVEYQAGTFALADLVRTTDKELVIVNEALKKAPVKPAIVDSPLFQEYLDTLNYVSKGVSGTPGVLMEEIRYRQNEDNNFVPFLKDKLGLSESATILDIATALKKGNDKNFGKNRVSESRSSKSEQITQISDELKDSTTEIDAQHVKGWDEVEVSVEDFNKYVKVVTTDVSQHVRLAKDNNVRKTLEVVAKSDSPFSEVAKSLLQDSTDKDLDVPIYYEDSKKSGSRYHGDTNKIFISSLDNLGVYGIRDATVIHEILHALTVRKMPATLSSRVTGKQYKSLLDNYRNPDFPFADKIPESTRKIIDIYLDAAEQMGLTEQLFGENGVAGSQPQKAVDKGIFYGMGNINEFITEAFTNSKFQERLNGLKSNTQNKSIWTRLLDAVKKLFGFDVKYNSILESAIFATSDLVKASEHSESWNQAFNNLKDTPPNKTQNFEFNPEENQDDESDPFSGSEDILSLITGKKSDFRKAADKFIRGLKTREIEQKLIIEEKPVYKALKRIDYNHLSDSEVREYIRIFQDFVNTRSHVENPQDTRIKINEVLTQTAALQKTAERNEFQSLKDSDPDLFVKKDKDTGNVTPLEFEDFNNDITAVRDFVGQAAGLKDIGVSQDERLEWIDKVILLQDELRERVSEGGPIGNVDDLFSTIENPIDHGNEHLNKINPIIAEFKDDAKDFYRDYAAYLTSLDPASIASFRDTRNLYYSLLSIVTDGYPLASNNFISSQLDSLLKQEGIKFRNASTKIGETATEKSSSFATKLNNLSNGADATNALYRLTSSYRESIKRAERVENEIINPYLNEALAKREKQQGNPFNNEDHSRMGIYAMLRSHYINETPTEGFFKNVKWLRQSLDNHARTNDKNLNKFAKFGDEVINKFMEGINDNDPEAMPKFEANAQKILGDAQIGYVADGVKLFESLKPVDKFAQEFGYGRKFEEIVNYIPSYSSQIRESAKSGKAYNDSQTINLNELTLATDFESFLNGRAGQVRDPRINTSGMSSTHVRHRVVSDNRVLELNINRLLHNRARLNVMDSFTAVRRREMANVLKSQGLKDWLGDSDGQLGRVDYLNRIITRSWQNMIQNTSYLGPFHVVMNKLMGRFASFRLFGFYQFPAQTISNSMTYFAQNITEPSKIMDFFRASSFILANKDNPQFKPFLDRLLTDLRNRSQEVFLDKTSSLDINVESIWQDFKATKIFGKVRDLDNLRQDWMFRPFKWSDMASGEPMLLAEYLHLEKKAGRATDFANLTYNPESYFQSLDNTEKMVGIGSASRRGLWLHNRDSSIALLRNLLTMFSSHRINNATNFGVALRDVLDGSMSIEDRSRAARFMLGVTAQTAAFATVKAGLVIMLGKAIMNAAKGDEDDDLEALFAKNKDAMSPKEKEMMQQEISTRRNIRSALQNFENRNSSARLIAWNATKDLVSNMWFGTAFSDMPTDMLMHFTVDEMEERSFREFKEHELERLNNLIKKEHNPKARASLMEAHSDLQSQESMNIVFENHSIINMGGLVGPFIKANYDFATETRDSILDHGEVTLEEAAMLFGTYGVGSPDLMKYLKLREKVIDARVKGTEAKEKAIEKLYKDHKIPRP